VNNGDGNTTYTKGKFTINDDLELNGEVNLEEGTNYNPATNGKWEGKPFLEVKFSLMKPFLLTMGSLFTMVKSLVKMVKYLVHITGTFDQMPQENSIFNCLVLFLMISKVVELNQWSSLALVAMNKRFLAPTSVGDGSIEITMEINSVLSLSKKMETSQPAPLHLTFDHLTWLALMVILLISKIHSSAGGGSELMDKTIKY
jgi:hypothetical protein